MANHKLIIVALICCLLVAGDAKATKNRAPLVRGDKAPRNFTAWMQTVPTDVQFGSGLKNLLVNINPSVTQAQADQFIADITSAAVDFPDFCNSGNDTSDMAEFSAFLTIVGAETSFSVSAGFPCERENGCPNCDACSYDSNGKECDDDPNKQYYGRGPLQLSWNYNYADYSQYYYNDSSILVNNPDLVMTNGSTCWASSIWFWMVEHDYGGWCMPQAAWPSFNTCDANCPDGPSGCSNSACSSDHWLPQQKTSCHAAMQGTDGIGTVISIINGGYDCCPSTTYGRSYGHTSYRLWWFEDIYNRWNPGKFITALNPVPINNCPLAVGASCAAMSPGPCYNACCNLQ